MDKKVIFAIFTQQFLWRAATWILFAAALLGVEAARAGDIGTETVLHSFSGTFNDGSQPTRLVQFSDGSLYGVTVGLVVQGSTVTNDAVYFKITTGGTYTPLANACGAAAGCTPGAVGGNSAQSSPIDGGDGNLYAVTSNGSFGEFLRFTPQGAFTSLFIFPSFYTNNVDFPGGSQLILGSDGNFYGTTYGGTAPGTGAIYRLTPGGSFTQLHAFSALSSSLPQTNSDGAFLNAPLVEDSGGNFYGVTLDGGANGTGTIFKLTPGGTFSVLHTFTADPNTETEGVNADGASPGGGLLLAGDGNFYGTTQFGGAHGVGTIFRITPAGVFTKLHDFGVTPQPNVTLSANPATISAGQSSTLTWSFTGAADFYEGGTPVSQLTQGADGNFYGVAGSPLAGPSGGEAGGGQFGKGIAFQLTPGGTFTILYSFGSSATDGADPYTGLIQASDGNFYGTTYTGGADPAFSGEFGGTVYKLSIGPAPAASPPCTASNAWSGSEPAGGSFVASPTTPGTYSYTLSCLTISGLSFSQTVVLTVTAPATPPPTVTIAADPASLELGNSSTLTWSSTNATTCTASGAWSGTQATSGTQSVTPSATGTSSYTLSCTGSGGSISSTASITVTAPPLPTVTIAANPASLLLGNSTTLTWSSTNATACTASGAWSGTRSTSGTQSVTPGATGTNSYTLSCTGSGGSISGTASVSVTAPVPTVMIAVNPTAITVGQGASLSWSSTNATSCTASGAWSGTQTTSGTLSESPAAAGSDVYTLSCTGSGGSSNASATLTVSAVPPPPPTAPTVTIAANPPAITLGQATTLNWSSTNATSCTASGAWTGAEPTGGSMNQSPGAAGTSIYTLSCTGPGGIAAASANVTVTTPTPAAPTLRLAAEPAAITLGQNTTLNWSSANATRCTASGDWRGDQETSGSTVETPAVDGASVYTLSCSGPGGTVVAAATVTVTSPAVSTTLSGKAGGGGFGFGSLFGLGLFALLRQRRLRRGAGVFLMLFCVPAFAQELNFDLGSTYVGVRGGVSTYSVDSGQLNSATSGAGGATSTSIDHHKGVGVLYAGVPFYHGLAVELGYADLGVYHVNITTSSANVAQVAQDTVGQLKPAGRGVTLGIGGPYDLGRWFAIEPHLGALIYQSRQEVFTPGGTYTKGDYGIGLDAGVALLAHPFRPIYAGAGFECFDTSGGCNVLMSFLQLEYHFGR